VNRVRALLGAAGALVLVLAWATLSGQIGPVVPLSGFVDALGNDYFLVVVVAGVAVAVAVPLLASGRESRLDQAEMPDPERPTGMPTPGDDFDDALSDPLLFFPLVGRRRRRAVRERLVAAAARAIERAEGCGEAEARRRIEDGTWTSDPVVGRFLAESSFGGPSSGAAGALAAGTLPIRVRARRTVDAIERYGDRPPGGDA